MTLNDMESREPWHCRDLRKPDQKSVTLIWSIRFEQYIERALIELKNRGEPIREDLVRHLSPLGWEHINLTGDYIWNLDRSVSQGKFRSLRIP